MTLFELQPEGGNHYRFEIPGQPLSKARVRVTSRGSYTPARQRKNAQYLAGEFRKQVSEPLQESVAVEMVFYRKGKQRIDLDNLVKQALDAATGICWVDDVQVVKITATLELDNANPRTLIDIRSHYTSMPRGSANYLTTVCVTCEAPIRYIAYPSIPKPPKYCSRACQRRQTRACEECAAEYVPNSLPQRFCSKQCASQNLATRRKIATARMAAAAPPNLCRSCGARLGTRRAVMCRACWLSSPGKKTTRAQILLAEAS